MQKLEKIINNTNRQYAFIDESGNYGFKFDKPGVSSHFIISAIIIDEASIEDLEVEVERIRKKYFGNSEMKSSGIGKDHERRERILSEISNLNFHIYSVIIDKRLIFDNSGLMYKQSFIKNLNGKLHRELKLTFPKLQLVADTHGSKEFMEGFKNYVNSHQQPYLFDEYEFGFDNSKSNVLIQLADLVAGTLSYKYEASKDNSAYYNFSKYLDSKIIALVRWPIPYDNYIFEYERYSSNRHDSVIYSNSIRLAVDYIKKYENTKLFEVKERVIVLKYLISMLLSGAENRYISSGELMENLKAFTQKDCSHHYFKTKIIAKLRDDGVLIASSNKGYKIPESENDIYSFVNQVNSMIQPMLSRLKKARERVKAATKNELDILEKDEFIKLKNMLDE